MGSLNVIDPTQLKWWWLNYSSSLQEAGYWRPRWCGGAVVLLLTLLLWSSPATQLRTVIVHSWWRCEHRSAGTETSTESTFRSTSTHWSSCPPLNPPPWRHIPTSEMENQFSSDGVCVFTRIHCVRPLRSSPWTLNGLMSSMAEINFGLQAFRIRCFRQNVEKCPTLNTSMKASANQVGRLVSEMAESGITALVCLCLWTSLSCRSQTSQHNAFNDAAKSEESTLVKREPALLSFLLSFPFIQLTGYVSIEHSY